MDLINIIDRVLAIVGERVEDFRKENLASYNKHSDLVTEGRMSEDLNILAVICGLRNNLWDLEKRVIKELGEAKE